MDELVPPTLPYHLALQILPTPPEVHGAAVLQS